MKKIFLLFLLFFTPDSFASGIASNSASAPCTNNTLETYSGNSNLQADWQPNTIQLRWYNGNTQIVPTNSSANTCTYDGSLTIPSTAPTRTGYTFAGWQVRPEMDFSTISVETFIYGYGRGATDGRWCGYWSTAGKQSEGYDTCNNQEFNDLSPQEWKTQLGNGWLYGMAKCSAKIGSTHNNTWDINNKSGWTSTYDELDSAIGDKKYCWCKSTGYILNNDNKIYAPSNNLLWVYTMDTGNCTWSCALLCGGERPYARGVNFRSALVSQ